MAWNIVAAPNPGWATQIFGEPDLERLWEALRVAMRLDAGDPVAAWQRQRETLARRAQALNALRADRIRFRGEGTDLSVGLLEQGLWSSGSFRTRAGIEFMPNLPTEEVFTSPDRRRADGVVRVTRPLVMPRAGVLVEGLELRFENGRIVEARADRGSDAVIAELDTDEGARSLGEVALVDSSSRIREAGDRLPQHALRRERRQPPRVGPVAPDGDRGRNGARRTRSSSSSGSTAPPCTPTS